MSMIHRPIAHIKTIILQTVAGNLVENHASPFSSEMSQKYAELSQLGNNNAGYGNNTLVEATKKDAEAHWP